jgi:glycosyltransferase involved in cell wall biosynthesis
MKILMLAPEPFFQPRGTPISVYFRLRALSDLGHEVDLVTYHLGEDKLFPGLKIYRTPKLFFIRKIKIGPSLAKLPLDFLLFCRAAGRLIRKRYDLVFSHEEGAFLGVVLSKLWKEPHLYDMHSSLPQQLENFNFSRSRILKAVFNRMERFILKNSRSIIVICRDLQNQVERGGFGDKAVLIENFLDFPSPRYSEQAVREKRRALAPRGEKIVLYAGNFQHYQGIPLLLEAAAKVKEPAVFVLLGGTGVELEEMRRKAAELGIASRVVFVEKVPPSEVPLFISAADVLVSPRLSGTNTPLKIYSFLKSGKPFVATNLWTHTQVLTPEISLLAEPDPESLAKWISFGLTQEEAQCRAAAARALAEKKYVYPEYLKKITMVLDIAAGTPSGKD